MFSNTAKTEMFLAIQPDRTQGFFPALDIWPQRPVLWGEPEKQHREKQHKAQRWRQANTWSRLKIMWSGLVHYCGFSPKWVGLIPEGLCFPPEFPNILKTTGNRQCLPSKNTHHEKAGAGRFLQASKNKESKKRILAKLWSTPNGVSSKRFGDFKFVNIGGPLKSPLASELADLAGFFVGWNTLPETNSSHLKMDAWNTSFLLGSPIFRCYVSRDCNSTYGGLKR